MEKFNLLIVHGGGPTPVMNASLYGAVTEAKSSSKVNQIFAALGGTDGILQERFKDLSEETTETLKKLLETPGTAIGTSRYEISEEEYQKMPAIFKKHNIRYVLFNGGNGTMDTCGKVQKACEGSDILVVGIPKTIDNDLALTDHAPGYGSAANYLAKTTAEIGMDVKSLPIHVAIIEAMGRNAGWITAASALARKKEGDAPHLIYLPEVVFDEKKFLRDVEKMHQKYGGVVVVASEGLKTATGESIVPPLFSSGRSVYPGDVGTYLAELVIRELGIKARSEKPGLAGRASITMQSKVDCQEAILVGKRAVQVVLQGKTGVMIGLKRLVQEDYAIELVELPLAEVMLHEKLMPQDFYSQEEADVTPDFIDWCRPLINPEVSNFINFNEEG